MTFFMENSLEFRFADSFVFSEEFHMIHSLVSYT